MHSLTNVPGNLQVKLSCKWDLIRWGLLSQKIEEAKAAYKELIKVAPKKLYYKMKADKPGEIHPESICWYEEPQVTTDC